MNKAITAHMVVRNEDRFIWYAISSLLPYVDQFIIFDTGSIDNTVAIIQSFRDKKIIFQQKKETDAQGLVSFRSEQIKLTQTDWIWVVDGDEIYPKKTIKNILQITKSKKEYLGIIVHRYDLLGDIYHYQDESVGAYDQFGKKGHYVLRLINKKRIEGLQVLSEYPNEYYANKNGQSIKSAGKNQFAFVEERIFHAMYLKRSSTERDKRDIGTILNRKRRKIELGRSIPKQEIPEVFFKEKPIIIPDVTKKRSWIYIILALTITPIKQLKRRIFIPNVNEFASSST